MVLYNSVQPGDFTWDSGVLLPLIGRARFLQGQLLGEMRTLPVETQSEIHQKIIVGEVACLGKVLGYELGSPQVLQAMKSQGAPCLPDLPPAEKALSCLVSLINEIVENPDLQPDTECVLRWHALIKTITSGVYPLPDEKCTLMISQLISWLDSHTEQDDIIKAGVVFFSLCASQTDTSENLLLGFLLSFYFLRQSDNTSHCFYNMASVLASDLRMLRESAVLSISEGNNLTGFMSIFIKSFINMQKALPGNLSGILYKNAFWERADALITQPRQRKMLKELRQRQLEAVSVSAWAQMAQCSTDTALRDIAVLISHKILVKSVSGGRSTNYSLNIK